MLHRWLHPIKCALSSNRQSALSVEKSFSFSNHSRNGLVTPVHWMNRLICTCFGEGRKKTPVFRDSSSRSINQSCIYLPLSDDTNWHQFLLFSLTHSVLSTRAHTHTAQNVVVVSKCSRGTVEWTSSEYTLQWHLSMLDWIVWLVDPIMLQEERPKWTELSWLHFSFILSF